MAFVPARRLIAISCLIACLAQNAWSQAGSPDPTFLTPGISHATANAMAAQSDGKFVLAGNYIPAAQAGRAKVVKYNADGSFASGFALSSVPDQQVDRIAITGTGKIAIQGAFTKVGTANRAGLALLNANGSLDTAFNPGAAAPAWQVSDIAFQADGKLLVAGSFASFGSSAKPSLVRLLASGTPDPVFSGFADINGQIYLLRVAADGKILIIGQFSTVNGTPRRGIARLNANGSLDTTFVPAPGLHGPRDIRGCCVMSDGKIILGTSYFSGEISRYGIVRLNADGSFDPSFDAGRGPNSRYFDVFDGGGGRVLMVGFFFSVDGMKRRFLARLDATGKVDPLFDAAGLPGSNYGPAFANGDGTLVTAWPVESIYRLLATSSQPPPDAPEITGTVSDGHGVRVIWTDARFEEGYRVERSADGASGWTTAVDSPLASAFEAYAGGLDSGASFYFRVRAYNRFGDGPPSAPVVAATLNAVWPGQVDLSFDPARSGMIPSPSAALRQADGKWIVSAEWYFGDESGFRVARLNADGSLDRFFDARSDKLLNPLRVENDGRVLVGGRFHTADGSLPERRLAWFLPDGQEDPGFSPVIEGGSSYDPEMVVARQPDGRLIVGGLFTSVGGVPRSNLARLNTDGSLDTTFSTSANGKVTALALDSQGRIVIGGKFTQVNGAPSGSVARLLANGATDPDFTNTTGGDVRTLAIGSGDRITVARGTSPTRLLASGAVDPDFTADANGFSALIAQPDGSTLIGGSVLNFGTVSRQGIARLLEDGSLDPTLDAAEIISTAGLAIANDGGIIATGKVTFRNGVKQEGPILLSGTGGPPPPPAPQGVTAAALDFFSIRVSWLPVAGADGYVIERNSGGYPPVFIGIASVPAGIVEFTDTGLSILTNYTYRISALNPAGASLPSMTVSTKTVIPNPFQRWRISYGLDPEVPSDADGDADGLNDLLEYAFNGNPLVPDPQVLPVPVLSADMLSLSYTPIGNGVEYRVEVSTNLLDWTTDGVTRTRVGSIYTYSVARDPAVPKFLRFLIMNPAN